jgi:hypothetical protein
VSAFDIVQIRTQLGKSLADQGWRGPQTIFNLTGGTKTMAFAAYELAVRLGSDFIYLQSEGGRSLIYRYVTVGGAPVLEGEPQEVPPLLTIDDYLRVHVETYVVEGYAKGDGGLFEKAVHDALQPCVDEICAGVRFSATVEVDLIVRCGNQLGIIEAKMGKPSKEGIGQLTTAGGREYLGTYTRRLLIVGRSWAGVDDLKDLAAARDITLIELPSYQQTGSLSQSDVQVLQEKVRKALRCTRAAPTS